MKLSILRTAALFFALTLLAGAQAESVHWLTSYPQAIKQAQKTGRPVFAYFTGSDWCKYCISLDRAVFDKPEFKKWADRSVVLLKLDFLRHKPVPKDLKLQNDALLQKFSYTLQGFPTILFLRGDGKPIGQYGFDATHLDPELWTAMADRLVRPKAAPARPLRFRPRTDGYPTPVLKNLFANNDLREKPGPKISVEQWLTGRAPDTIGKVVLIDFWATWCMPCRAMIGELNVWQKKYGKDLVVIGISDEKPQIVQQFLKSTTMAYNVAVDTKHVTEGPVDVTSLPHVVIMSPDHIVRWQGFPNGQEEQLTDTIIKQIIDASKKRTVASRR